MQKLAGSLVVVAGLWLLIFPDSVPVVSHLFAAYWLRAAGGVLSLLGAFLFWAAGD